MKWVRGFGYVVFLCLCLLAGVAGHVFKNATGSLGSVGEVWQGISNPRSLFPGKQRLVLLLVGQDYMRDRLGKIQNERSRADTIMMLSVDLEKRSIRACSVPRDTRVMAPDGRTGKINGTFERGGVPLLEQTLQELLGVSFDGYVIVRPSAVRQIVDSVGGVTVEAIDAMKYKDSWGGLDIDLPKGTSHVNGQQAEGYVRFREVNTYRLDSAGRMIPIKAEHSLEEGDLRRTARQQLLVQALIGSAMQPSNLIRADKIIETGFGQIDTNLSRVQLLALATIFKESGSANMLGGTLPGSDSNGGVYYYVLDEDRSKAMVDWLVNGNDAAMRELARVSIRDGSKARGAGRQARSELEGMGYTNVTVSGTASLAKTKITYSKAAFEPAAREVAKALGALSVEKGSGPPLDWRPEVTVELGDDIAARLVTTP